MIKHKQKNTQMKPVMEMILRGLTEKDVMPSIARRIILAGEYLDCPA